MPAPEPDPWTRTAHSVRPEPTSSGVADVLVPAVLGCAGAVVQGGAFVEPAVICSVVGVGLVTALVMVSGVADRAAGAVAAVLGVLITAGALGTIVDRTTVIVTAATVALVRVAWVGRPLAARGRCAVALPLVVPFVVGADLNLVSGGPVLRSGAVLAAGAAVAAAGLRWPHRSAAIERAVGSVIGVASELIVRTVVLVIALPTLYVPGALARLARVGRRSGASVPSWTPVEVTAQQVAGDAPFMFASTGDRLRRRRQRGSLSVVVLAMLLVTVSSVASEPQQNATRALAASASGARPFSSLPAFRGVDFADALQAEQARFITEHLIPDPTTRYRAGGFESPYTNVGPDGRDTASPPACGCTPVTVWFVGGSAAFGMGQRDLGTIPSALVRRAAGAGYVVKVRNLAVPGWTTAQEVAAIEERLDAGADRPDLIVTYDGFNDVYEATAVATVLGEVPEIVPPATAEVQLRFQEMAGRGDGALARSISAVGGPSAIAEVVVRNYLAQQAELGRVAAGVPVMSFVQTDAMVSPAHRADAAIVNPALASEADSEAWGEVLASVDASLIDAGVSSLRSVVAEVGDPIFIDAVHTNERGAELIASAMFDELEPLISQLAPRVGSNG